MDLLSCIIKKHYIELKKEIDRLIILYLEPYDIIIQLPQYLKYLSIGYMINTENVEFPQHLLYLYYERNTTLGRLPRYLLYLILNPDYNKKINEFPQYLVYLYLNGFHDRENREFPQYISYLHLGYYFKREIKKCSQCLLYLHLGFEYKYGNHQEYSRCIGLCKTLNKEVFDKPNSYLNIYYYY
jgi:hypothetical protein